VGGLVCGWVSVGRLVRVGGLVCGWVGAGVGGWVWV